jgi:hypothetical protein
MAIIWSALAFLLTFLFIRRLTAALVIGAVVFSHWILDFLVWKDMLLLFNEKIRVGFGLYDALGFSKTNMTEMNTAMFLTSAIELSLLTFGVVKYVIYVKNSKRSSGN